MEPPPHTGASGKPLERNLGPEECPEEGEYEASVSEGCSATNTPGSILDCGADGGMRFVSPPSITTAKSLAAPSFNPAAAPFVPSASASPFVPAAAPADLSRGASEDTGKVVDEPKRWYCQLLGPVFLKPLTAEQWTEELERLAQVTVGSVEMLGPADSLCCCVTLTAVGDTLRHCHGRNMSSRSNGTWTLVAEPVVSVAFTQTKQPLPETDADAEAVSANLSEEVGCSFLSTRVERTPRAVDAPRMDGAATNDAMSIVADVRASDALYLLGWNRCLSIGKDGTVSRGDAVVVARRLP